jgi:hypothetical protein
MENRHNHRDPPFIVCDPPAFYFMTMKEEDAGAKKYYGTAIMVSVRIGASEEQQRLKSFGKLRKIDALSLLY